MTFSQDILGVIQKSSEQIYMLLDDFHFISDPTILNFINRLLLYCPAQFHLIITSRVQPGIELSSLYVQGLLFSLGAEQLKFSLTETQSLLSDFVDQTQQESLYRQTEGWPVALQLLRLWYQQNPHSDPTCMLTNNIDTLTGYMREQVFEKFTLSTQNFLMKTAFLDRFDIELANYICGIDNSADFICDINEHQSLIISLDEHNSSFRYHHLFSDFLQQTFASKVGEHACNQLRSKAALWFADKNYLSEAVSQCVRAKNIELATKLIAQAGGWEMIMTKGIGYVESLLSHFSQQDITQSPSLGLLQCYFYLKMGQVVLAEEQFHIAELIHQDRISSGQDSDVVERDFLVNKLLVRVYLDQIIENDVLLEINESMKCLPFNDHLARGTLLAIEALLYNQNAKFNTAEKTAITCAREMRLANCWIGVNYITLHHGQSLAYRGHLKEAMALFNDANQMAQEHLGMDSGLQSMAMCLTAEVHYQMGELDQAKALLDKGITALELRDCWYDIYAVTFKLGINLALADNDKAACDDYLQRGKEIVLKRKLWRLEMLLDVLALKIALHFADMDLFNQLNNKIIREKYWQEELYLWKAKEEYHAIQAMLFLQKNASRKALFHADKLLTICQESQQNIGIAKAQLIQALAYASADDTNKAFKILAVILQNCVQYNIRQIFSEVPASIEALLIKFKQQGEGAPINKLAEEFVTDLLRVFKTHNESTLTQLGLSHREQQLIPLLIQGQSNKQMSVSLGISENTIKFHLKNLFAKIKVNNRSEATVFFLTAGFE